MVNTGKPSGACRTCLKKRIKGYRSSAELTFKDQNAYAAAKVEARQAQKFLQSQQQAHASQPHLDISLPSSILRAPSPAHLITSTAIEHFSHDYALGTQPSPLFSTLPTQWSRSALQPALLEALPAVSLANACTRARAPDSASASSSSSSPLLAAARHRYGAALARLATALRRPAALRDKQLLLALVLLNLFEMMSGDMPSAAGDRAEDLHYAGKVALLRMRGEEGLKDDDGRVLFRMVFAQVCVADLVAGRRPPCEGRRWLEVLWREGGGYLADGVLALEWEMAEFCARAGEVVKERAFDGGRRLQELLVEGEELFARLEGWAEGGGDEWQFEKKRSVGPRREGEVVEGCETVHVYHNLITATEWNFSRTLRIHLANTLLDLAARMRAVDPVLKLLTGVRQARWQRAALDLVDEICGGMAFILGDCRQGTKSRSFGAAVVGYQSLWPLRVALTVGGIRDKQRAALMGWMRYIGHELGLQQAVL
ncbi:hypothetical protein B0J12DRAFT_727538 [Macrophomina phaseolina]|uniref:Uncharacterized protein n=1 Tax=Macrophomina phaseolina TaxID=35725 RepID=A0ABQ8GEX0_9PEZI|nr:hypothetical protein B0J12DRAFT_727538 [Macrophomina phaseolina]